MAHKTLIDGTAYEVKGGRCLVDGTGYGVQKGRTLVDGTGYDVLFATSAVTVNVTGSGDSRICSVTVGGVTFNYPNTGIVEVNVGDSIDFKIGSDDSDGQGEVYIDGSKKFGKKNGSAVYTWTIPDGCRYVHVHMSVEEYENENAEYCDRGVIKVTTYDAVPTLVTVTGSGSSTYCYATINGSKVYNKKDGTVVSAGDVITFGVYGYSSTYYGEVVIDGNVVVTSTGKSTVTYAWTIPDGITVINISLTYTSTSSKRNGRITVTTT